MNDSLFAWALVECCFEKSEVLFSFVGEVDVPVESTQDTDVVQAPLPQVVLSGIQSFSC